MTTTTNAPIDFMTYRMVISRVVFAGYFAGTAVVWPHSDFSTRAKT